MLQNYKTATPTQCIGEGCATYGAMMVAGCAAALFAGLVLPHGISQAIPPWQ